MVIDASVWVAVFAERDIHHRDATTFLERALELRLTLQVPALALSELGGAIARRTGDRQSATLAVQYLSSQSWIAIHHGSAALSQSAANVAVEYLLRGADATYVALALQLDAPLVTLDKEMCLRAPSAANVVTPTQWLQRLAASGV